MESTKETNENYNNIILKADRLKVWTPQVKPWWRRAPTKTEVIILNDVSVNIRMGELVAVIGPSGAGKTTFLVSLAGKCTLPSSGVVTINGRNIKDLGHGTVEIVPQFDVFMDSLSVMEHLIFMIEMKLGSVKRYKNKRMMKTLIHELKLESLIDTPTNALSGGERKLLSLASSLISNPKILICDEPTTGLDSYNAALVISVLKKISTTKIIICSVHQPSSDLFKEFNTICLMSEGKLLFHGKQDDCKKLFDSVNLVCPKNFNPAEYYIGVVSKDTDKHLVKRLMSANSVQSDTINDEPVSPVNPKIGIVCNRFWLKQVYLLLWRASLTQLRNIKSSLVELFVCALISSFIIGTCYNGISGYTQRGIQDIKGFLWLMCSEISFTISYGAMYAFEGDLALFKREVGMYSASAFYLSRFLSMVPRCVIWPLAYVTIASAAVQLPNHLLTTCQFTTALIAMSIASVAYGLGMGAMFISTGIMADVMPCADLPLFLVAGVFLRLSAAPMWLYPVKYISHFYYGMDAISNIYWRQIDNIECTPNSTLTCLKTGEAVLLQDGYSSNFVIEDSIGVMCVTIMWSVLGYCGLKREEIKGYAY